MRISLVLVLVFMSGLFLVKDLSANDTGRLVSTGTINVGYAVREFSILTKGLETSTTSNYWIGTLYQPDGEWAVIYFDVPLALTFTFTSSLQTGTTIYYIIRRAY